MNVVLRVDSSLSIGSGHVVRCLNLAKALRKTGLQCHFVMKNHKGNIIQKIKQEKFPAMIIPCGAESDTYIRDEKFWLNGSQQDDAKEFLSLVSQQNIVPDIIIIDHYSLDSEWESIVKSRYPVASMVVIDDLCNRQHYCDLLIDQTFQRTASEYTHLNQNNGNILTGTKYSLIDPVFYELRNASIARKSHIEQAGKLLITMGGVDVHNVTGKVLSFLEKYALPDIKKITVIIGTGYPYRAALDEFVARSKYKIVILSNVQNMAELMLEHDFAIGALGGTTWERCVMAIPAVNISIADNQNTIAQNLSTAGAIVLHANAFSGDELKNAINHLLANYHEQRLLAMSICDGRGLSRLMQEIVILPAKDGVNVTLRQATSDDIDYVYQLQCEPKTRQFARDTDIPLYDNHVLWMQQKLNESKTHFYIIEHGGPCGVLRLEPVIHDYAQFEISIFLTAASHGKGVASAAIRRALSLHSHACVLATVLLKNVASQQLFERLGFIKIAPCEYISEKDINE